MRGFSSHYSGLVAVTQTLLNEYGFSACFSSHYSGLVAVTLCGKRSRPPLGIPAVL
jgi:hypothetical protein